MQQTQYSKFTDWLKILTPNNSRTNSKKMHTGGSGALTHQSDVVGITSEKSDVLLYPVQSSDLVHEAIIRNPRFGLRRHVGVQEAEYAQPVVHGDDHLVGVAS